ncbi:hypothetical protein [Acidocella sp.]|uniref:hypothetical protein n=1 Tax=Acidocella sp. TaxID=50710 RepID=UPI003CFE321E
MPLHGDEKTLGRGHVFLLLAGFAVLVLARLPNILLQGGRFWAEEGVVYFSHAWSHPWWQAWFTIHTGYINFIAGFGAWLGLELGGLAHAPLVTVLLALLVQMLPPFIILTHAFPWRGSRLGSLVAVALCAVPPVTGEVWLNTITSQFHFALAASLILAAPAARGALLGFDMLVIAVAVLSGPATSFLTPLFMLRAAVTRRRADLLLCAVILTGLCLQIGVYLTHLEPARDGHLSFQELLSAIALHVVTLGLAGFGAAQKFAAYSLALHRQHAFLWPGTVLVLLFYALLGWAVLGSKRHKGGLALLLGAQILFAFVSFDHALFGDFSGVMRVIGDQRYAFASMVLTGLLLTGSACASEGGGKFLRAALAGYVLAVGIWNYRAGSAPFADGPAWAPQIRQWRQNPRMVLSVWPDSWYMQLPPRR